MSREEKGRSQESQLCLLSANQDLSHPALLEHFHRVQWNISSHCPAAAAVHSYSKHSPQSITCSSQWLAYRTAAPTHYWTCCHFGSFAEHPGDEGGVWMSSMAGALDTVMLPDWCSHSRISPGYPKTIACGLRNPTIVSPQMLHLKLCNLDLSMQLWQPVDPLL